MRVLAAMQLGEAAVVDLSSDFASTHGVATQGRARSLPFTIGRQL